MGDRTFVDTNVLLYLFDVGEPVKSKVARTTYDALAPGDCVLSTQVLQEFYWNSTRKLKPPLRHDEAVRLLGEFSAHTTVVVDLPLILAATARGAAHRIPYWDALVVETALSAGCTRLLSEDLQHGRRFGDLVVENPFAAAH